MELYLLKSTVILAILYVFYKLVLENTSIHNFKRFYLLGSLVASLVIPFITFTSYGKVSAFHTIYTEGIPQLTVDKTIETINYWPFVLWTIYGLGVLFFTVKFIRNLFSLIQQIRKNPKRRDGGFIHILLEENVIPYTFFRYIFLKKENFESGNIPAEVLIHEEAHARQNHSLDIILIEILKIVFWFNPLFYFLKRSIKLNHEFLADEAVLKNGFETSAYQKLLMAFLNPNNQTYTITPQLAHSITYSSMKKRFLIMKTNTSRRTILFRSLLILPLLSFLIYGFSSTETIEMGNDNSYVSTNGTIEDIQIEIDENSKIYLNGKPVVLSNLKSELDKLNKSLTVEEKQKYLSARIELENKDSLNIAEEIMDILHSCNVRSLSFGILKNERDARLKNIPQKNPMAGKTVEEAEVLYQQHLIDAKKLMKANANVKKDENNPWSIEVQKNEDNPQSIEDQKDESNPWSIKVQKNATSKEIIDELRKQE